MQSTTAPKAPVLRPPPPIPYGVAVPEASVQQTGSGPAAKRTYSPDTSWPAFVPLDEFDVPPFPIETIPQPFRRHLEEVAREKRAPIDIAAMFLIGVFAAIFAKRVVLKRKRGFLVPVNMYVVTVAAPGVGKTPVLSAMVKPLQEAETTLGMAAAERISSARFDKECAAASLKRAKDAIEKNRKPEADASLREAGHVAQLAHDAVIVPTVKRYTIGNATMEALVQTLSQQDGTIGHFSAEGELFKIALGRYKGGEVAVEALNAAWGGERISDERISRDLTVVPNPALTIACAVQPSVVDSLNAKPEIIELGTFGRFMASWPAAVDLDLDDDYEMDDAVAEDYDRVVHELACTVVEWETPRLLTLDVEALVVVKAFEREINVEKRPGREFADESGFGSKLSQSTMRVAALLHCMKHLEKAPDYQVDRTTMESAVAIGRYWWQHQRKVRGMFGVEPVFADAKKVLARITGYEIVVVDQSKLTHDLQNKNLTPPQVKAALALLAKRNIVREEAPDKHNKLPRWRVHPDICATYAFNRTTAIGATV